MSHGVMTCMPETTVHEAVQRMTEHKVNALVVVQATSGELEGVVSHSDLARVHDHDYDSITVESVMNHAVETIIPDIPVLAAVQIMLDRNMDRLVIMHIKPAPSRPVGVLSLSDVIRDMAGEA